MKCVSGMKVNVLMTENGRRSSSSNRRRRRRKLYMIFECYAGPCGQGFGLGFWGIRKGQFEVEGGGENNWEE